MFKFESSDWQEHCLMGIKGTVRRSTDGDFIHANVDIDLVIAEEEIHGSDEKPLEIFHIIEHFCLGRRRLHLFGKDTTTRHGWLTIGPWMTSSNFDPELYNSYFNKEPNGFLTGSTEEIERLRPKSPPPKTMGGGGNMATNTMPRGGGQPRPGGPPRDGGAQIRGINPPRLAPPPRSNMIQRGGGMPWPRQQGFVRGMGRGWIPRQLPPPR